MDTEYSVGPLHLNVIPPSAINAWHHLPRLPGTNSGCPEASRKYHRTQQHLSKGYPESFRE